MIGVSGLQNHAIVNIARTQFPAGNVDQVIAWGQAHAAAYKNYLPLPLEMVVGNTNRYIQEYTWSNSTLFRCQDLYIFASDNGYTVTFCSDDSKWPILESYFLTMMQSFSIKGQ